jgi:large subunit ribosomal protein L17
MRHGKKLAKLARPTDQRLAMLKSLTRELIIHKRIMTTLKRAQAAQFLAEKIIALARRGGLAAQKLALRILPDKTLIKNIFKEFPKIYQNRSSGFTRVVRCGRRLGDAAQRVILELVEKGES